MSDVIEGILGLLLMAAIGLIPAFIAVKKGVNFFVGWGVGFLGTFGVFWILWLLGVLD